MDIAAMPVTALEGVGPKLAARLVALGIETVQDLLFHLPYRYEDRTRLVPFGELRPGMTVLTAGQIELADVVASRRRSQRTLLCRMSDGTGHLHLRFFHFRAAQRAQLVRGARLRLYGEVRLGPAGLEMVHPEYRLLAPGEAAEPETRLTPVYPAGAGLGQPTLRRLVRQVLERYGERLPEYLPPAFLAVAGYPTLGEALAYVHYPPPGADTLELVAGRSAAQERLAFEELLAHHLSLLAARAHTATQQAPRLDPPGRLLEQLLAGLPFTLTAAQRRVLAQIRADLARAQPPMQRLVQGDVGCGKTVVAAAAAALAIEAGYQVAVMAPTELLAEQHRRQFEQWFAPLGVEVAALTGKSGASTRRAREAALAEGRIACVVGTHALFQASVRFARLGLVIVDEQHRFGVRQRLRLREKGIADGRHPHQLIMTATPIPRTLAQTLYADLDVSVIDELPPGRKPVETVAVPASRRAEVVARLHAACRAGRQAYWVCPFIEEGEAENVQAATEAAAQLREALPDLRIALVHGRMASAEKERVMAAFKQGKADVLVATTVIEVGVDVPNASLMIIENAERLGLAQLHQLRGRVGRGGQDSACVLLYTPPLSETARARLAVLRETHDGFEIARRDLEMRGPGELLGTRQTGLPAFRIADLWRDQRLLPQVQQVAAQLLAQHPSRVAAIRRRWLGQAEAFADV
jgi:ATP-dependent DNA helicase RecG